MYAHIVNIFFLAKIIIVKKIMIITPEAIFIVFFIILINKI